MWDVSIDPSVQNRTTHKVPDILQPEATYCAAEGMKSGDGVREGEVDEDDLVVEGEAHVEDEVQADPDEARIVP